MSSPTERVDPQNLSKKGKEICALPYLPIYILFDILSRLEIKTLFKCRLVCKAWASIISTYEFSKLHLLRSPTNCLIKGFYIVPDDHSSVFQSLEPECPSTLENKLIFKPMINFPGLPKVIYNSCNGLVCLVQLGSDFPYSIFVCNPILREYIALPNPPICKMFFSITCLFGFSQNTNQYKVVVSDDKSHNMIYTCGEGSWKRIGSSPCTITNFSYNAFVNGNLHFMSYSYKDPFIICCFDFDSEEFHLVPQPSELSQHKRDSSDRKTMGVLNGNLSIFCSRFPNYDGVVIWVMKNYGDKESWCKDFVINCMFNHVLDEVMSMAPIMIKGNGEIVMIYNDNCFILYDTITKTCSSKQQICGDKFDFNAIAYTPSLISLKDVTKGENIKVVGRS